MGVHEDIPFRSKLMHRVGSRVTCDLEYKSGKMTATNVGYFMDHDELSSGHYPILTIKTLFSTVSRERVFDV